MLCKKKSVLIVFLIYIIIIVLFLVGINYCHVSSLEYRSSFLLPFYLIMYAVPAYLIGCGIHNIPIKNKIHKVITILYWSLVSIGFAILFFHLLFTLPEERKLKCGYLQLTKGEFLQEAHPYYAEPEALIFMKRFEWDAEHDIYILKDKYGMDFSLAPEKGDKIRRYIPTDSPEINVRIYFYDVEEIIDDYMFKMSSEAFLNCYKAHHMHREYEWDRLYEGDISFVYHNRDDLESFSKDMALMIKEAMKKQFFEKMWVR